MASTPRSAAFRIAPRRPASSAATANQSRPWLAALDTVFIVVSNGLGGIAETAREIARSTSFTWDRTLPAARRGLESTARPYGRCVIGAGLRPRELGLPHLRRRGA